MLQDAESVSRDAKVRWCLHNGHAVLSLQHDGIVASLRDGTTHEAARQAMQTASEQAVGYAQPVKVKAMPLPTGCTRTVPREEAETKVPIIGRRPTANTERPIPAQHNLCGHLDTRVPYANVEWDATQKRIFTGIDGRDMWKGRAYQHASRLRALQEDPVTRLFLRGRMAEEEARIIHQASKVSAVLDHAEREALKENRSVWHSARTLRVAMTLHAAHAFTHAAAVDSSKATVHENAATGDDEAEHNAEDRLEL